MFIQRDTQGWLRSAWPWLSFTLKLLVCIIMLAEVGSYLVSRLEPWHFGVIILSIVSLLIVGKTSVSQYMRSRFPWVTRPK